MQTLIEGMREECTNFIIFVFGWMNPLPTYPLMKDKDQNPVVRVKDFKTVSGLIGPKALRSFVIKGRKLDLKNHKSTM